MLSLSSCGYKRKVAFNDIPLLSGYKLGRIHTADSTLPPTTSHRKVSRISASIHASIHTAHPSEVYELYVKAIHNLVVVHRHDPDLEIQVWKNTQQRLSDGCKIVLKNATTPITVNFDDGNWLKEWEATTDEDDDDEEDEEGGGTGGGGEGEGGEGSDTDDPDATQADLS